MNPFIAEGQVKLHSLLTMHFDITQDPKYIGMIFSVVNLAGSKQAIDDLNAMIDVLEVNKQPDTSQFRAVVNNILIRFDDNGYPLPEYTEQT